MTMAEFSEFIEKSKALSGFFENGKMREKVFVELDPHKKGYLNESDFVRVFGGYEWKNQLAQ
jgi:hypothetical protein